MLATRDQSTQDPRGDPVSCASPGATPYRWIDDFAIFLTASRLGNLFLGVWILGTGFLLLREAAGLRHLRRARASWQPATASERADLLCPEDIALYVDAEQSPGTVGMLFPAVVLPKHFPDDLSLTAKRLILEHELAHARWHDPLISFLLRSIRAFFWISPALWLIVRHVRNEREAAADQAAIESLTESDPRINTLVYTDAVVRIAKQVDPLCRPDARLQTVGIGNGGSGLEQRISRLLLPVQITRQRFAAMVGAIVLTVAGTAIASWAAPSARALNLDPATAVVGDMSALPPEDQSTDTTPAATPPHDSLPSQGDAAVRSRRSARDNSRSPTWAKLAPLVAGPTQPLSELSRLRGEPAPLIKLRSEPRKAARGRPDLSESPEPIERDQ
jgi:beta-lactamase regulating signal transducer with metallopeptidase domain